MTSPPLHLLGDIWVRDFRSDVFSGSRGGVGSVFIGVLYDSATKVHIYIDTPATFHRNLYQ